MAFLPYRSNTLQCAACTAPVEPDHLYSFEGKPICDTCFLRQERPLPTLIPEASTSEYEPPMGRKALWLHSMGSMGWGGLLGVAVSLVGVASMSLQGGYRPLFSAAVVPLLGGSLALVAGAIRRADQRFRSR